MQKSILPMELGISLPFDDPDYIFELKFDGIRALAHLGGETVLISRNGNNLSYTYPELLTLHKCVAKECILDGEIIALDKGKPSFPILQQRMKNKSKLRINHAADKNPVQFVAFDILQYDKESLLDTPLIKRKELLGKVIQETPRLVISRFINEHGIQMFALAETEGLEGIVAKHKTSIYRPGVRSNMWLKIKTKNYKRVNPMLEKYNEKRDFKITAEPLGKIQKSSSKLHFVIQHHLSRREHYDFRLEWNGALLSWAVPKGVSVNPSDKRLAIHVEDHPLEYRHFQGEIPAGQYGAGTVTIWDKGWWEPLNSVENALAGKASLKFNLHGERLNGKWALVKTNKEAKQEQWLLIKEKNDISDTVKISSPDKILFKDANVTKLEVAEYYRKIAARMLPYLQNRRLALVVCPQGTDKDCFFKKNVGEGVVLPPINTMGELLSHVQNNSIEFHTWGSTIDEIDKPDVMVFDLDPDEGVGLDQVRQGVRHLKDILDELALKSFLKTSGNKGYHVAVPVKPSADWDAIGTFAKNIAILMEKKWPNLYTSNVRKINRKGKIFIDWIRNGKGATSVAPYSVRAKPGAGVSTPISWNELNKIAPNQVTIVEAITRLKKADPWQDFFQVMSNQKIK